MADSLPEWRSLLAELQAQTAGADHEARIRLWEVISQQLFGEVDKPSRQAFTALSAAEEARMRAEQDSARMALLADASGILARGHDPDASLAELAHLAASGFAELCVVSLADDSRQDFVRHTVAHRSRERARRFEGLLAALQGKPERPHLMRHVLSSGLPEIVIDVPPDLAERLADDPAEVLQLRELLPRHLLLAPLEHRGRVVGVLLLGREQMDAFEAADVSLAEELARRAAMAVDNAELLKAREQQLARMRLLADASRAFAEVTSVRAVCSRLSQLLTEDFAQACDVWLLDQQGVPERTAWRASDPALGELLERNGRGPGVECTTVRAAHVTLGHVLTARGPGKPPFSSEDRLLLREICDRAALALSAAHENQRVRHERERYRCLVQTTAQMVWTADAKGRRLDDARSWRAFTGQSYEQFKDRGWLDAVHPDDRDLVWSAWCRAIATTTPYEVELHVRQADGVYVPCLERAAPVRDSRGAVLEWIGLTADISRQKQIEQALRESNRRKDEFLAMLGHELRNPLTPMRLALEVLRVADGDKARTQRCHDIIDRQTDNLARLVDDLLDVSRITRGKIELRKEHLTAAPLVSRAVDAVRSLFEKAGHSFTVSVPSRPIYVQADAVRLEQVLVNLLTNAAKYTPRGGKVELKVEEDDGQLLLRVCDNGLGIAAEMLPRIFDLFEQADPGLARAQGGLGIGLTVVRRLVELHGGHVEARSPGPGRGSEFIVRLPVTTELGPPVEMQPAPRPPTSATGLRILVVDDNVDITDTLSGVLGDLGHDVRVAHEGEGALRLAEGFAPQLVILDIGLPGMSGYEVGLLLRQRLGPAVCLAALTGYGQQHDRARSRQAGLDHHLVKPLRLDELLEIVDGVSRLPAMASLH